MSNITGLTVSIHKITHRIKILINHVLAAEDRISDSFHCYQLYLETLTKTNETDQHSVTIFECLKQN